MARPKAIRPVAQDELFIKFALYGEPGVGKSTLAGTSPKALLLLNDGDEAAAAAERGTTADKWVVHDFNDLEKAYEYMRHEGVHEYEWLWIDNATLLQEQCMDTVMTDLHREKPHRNRWVPDQHEYLVVQNQLSTYLRYFKALPIHLGVCFHSMRSEDADGRVTYLPMLQGGQGALSQKVCGYMNVVGYMSVAQKKGKSTRKVSFDKRSKFYAKSRFGGLQGSLTDPTIPDMMKMIQTKLPQLGQREAAPSSKVPSTATKRKKTA